MVFFSFPEDARWNPDRSAVEFGVAVGDYEGVVCVSQRVFQHRLAETPTRNGALKPITFTEPALNSLLSGRFAAGN
jgi:hypothetical protein